MSLVLLWNHDSYNVGTNMSYVNYRGCEISIEDLHTFTAAGWKLRCPLRRQRFHFLHPLQDSRYRMLTLLIKASYEQTSWSHVKTISWLKKTVNSKAFCAYPTMLNRDGGGKRSPIIHHFIFCEPWKLWVSMLLLENNDLHRRHWSLYSKAKLRCVAC